MQRQLAIFGIAIIAALSGVAPVPAAARPNASVLGQPGPTDISAQDRTARRRAPTRIEVYPLRRPSRLQRECVAVYQERWIPQWGGLVLRPGQECWWVRTPIP